MLYNMTYAVIILVFAMIAMVLLLDIKSAKLPRGNRLLLFTALPCIVVVSIFLMLYFVKRFPPLYPLLVHIPLVIVLWIISGRGLLKVFFVLLTTIVLSYSLSLVQGIMARWHGLPDVWRLLGIAVAGWLLLAVVRRFIKHDFAYIMEQFGTRQILFFCTVPLGYNILSYLLGQYKMGSTVNTLRIVLFLSVLGVYFLLMSVVKHTKELQQLQSEKNMIEIQLDTARRQFVQLKAMQEQTVTYRHDMRHHLSLIGGYLADNHIEKLRSYLAEVQGDIDMLTPLQFCENETVNLVLSFFAEKTQKAGVSFSVDARLPKNLALPETELCAVLSNGLENAIDAATLADEGNRTVRVICKLNRDRLLIFIENTSVGMVTLEDGLPKTNKGGHGFGTKSMKAIAEKRNGDCSCESKEGLFTLRVVLPMDR